MRPMTEWDSMAILLTQEAHTDELAVPNIMPAIVAPRAALCTLGWLLIPGVVEGFNGIVSDLKGDCFIVW
jgi:hypothetical protein